MDTTEKLTFEVDVKSNAAEEFNNLSSSIKTVEVSTKKFQNTTDKLQKKLEDTTNTVVKSVYSYDKLSKTYKETGKNIITTTEKYRTSTDKLNKELSVTEKTVTKTIQKFDNLNKTMKNSNSSAGALIKKLGELKKVFGDIDSKAKGASVIIRSVAGSILKVGAAVVALPTVALAGFFKILHGLSGAGDKVASRIKYIQGRMDAGQFVNDPVKRLEKLKAMMPMMNVFRGILQSCSRIFELILSHVVKLVGGVGKGTAAAIKFRNSIAVIAGKFAEFVSYGIQLLVRLGENLNNILSSGLSAIEVFALEGIKYIAMFGAAWNAVRGNIIGVIASVGAYIAATYMAKNAENARALNTAAESYPGGPAEYYKKEANEMWEKKMSVNNTPSWNEANKRIHQKIAPDSASSAQQINPEWESWNQQYGGQSSMETTTQINPRRKEWENDISFLELKLANLKNASVPTASPNHPSNAIQVKSTQLTEAYERWKKSTPDYEKAMDLVSKALGDAKKAAGDTMDKAPGIGFVKAITIDKFLAEQHAKEDAERAAHDRIRAADAQHKQLIDEAIRAESNAAKNNNTNNNAAATNAMNHNNLVEQQRKQTMDQLNALRRAEEPRHFIIQSNTHVPSAPNKYLSTKAQTFRSIIDPNAVSVNWGSEAWQNEPGAREAIDIMNHSFLRAQYQKTYADMKLHGHSKIGDFTLQQKDYESFARVAALIKDEEFQRAKASRVSWAEETGTSVRNVLGISSEDDREKQHLRKAYNDDFETVKQLGNQGYGNLSEVEFKRKYAADKLKEHEENGGLGTLGKTFKSAVNSVVSSLNLDQTAAKQFGTEVHDMIRDHRFEDPDDPGNKAFDKSVDKFDDAVGDFKYTMGAVADYKGFIDVARQQMNVGGGWAGLPQYSSLNDLSQAKYAYDAKSGQVAMQSISESGTPGKGNIDNSVKTVTINQTITANDSESNTDLATRAANTLVTELTGSMGVATVNRG